MSNAEQLVAKIRAMSDEELRSQLRAARSRQADEARQLRETGHVAYGPEAQGLIDELRQPHHN